MHIFISAGEPSGDIHGANLIRHLRRMRPDATFVGFGGDRMREAGCQLLYPLVRLAVMWLLRVLANLPTFIQLIKRAERYFIEYKPDALIVIDFPGFHWALVKRAKRAGIPVFYYVPPQLWAWASWRVQKMQRWVDHVLCALPFEYEWYRQRGVNAHYIGHPFFDEITERRLNAEFAADQQAKGNSIIALLPGSRKQEVIRNLPTLLRTASIIHKDRPQVRFLVAAFNEEQAEMVWEQVETAALPIEVHVGRTSEIIEAAQACISVSGSVSLELMYRLKPTVIVYRTSWLLQFLGRRMMQCKYITLVNLLADEELFPEFRGTADESPAMAAQVLTWLNDPASREAVVERLRAIREQASEPGASRRAAETILAQIGAGERRAVA